MKNTTVNGMAIRLPKKIVDTLQQLKKEENLPSMAIALEFWLRQQVDERQQERLTKVEEKIERMHAGILRALKHSGKVATTNCEAVHYILGGNHILSQKLRKQMGCENRKCSFSNCPGLVRDKTTEALTQPEDEEKGEGDPNIRFADDEP